MVERLLGRERARVGLTPAVVRDSIRRRQDDQERRVEAWVRAEARAADQRRLQGFE